MPTLLPGCGRPLNYIPKQSDPDYIGELFKNALSSVEIESHEVAMSMTTLREFAMLQFMNSVTDKPDWHIKINNPEIAAKWKNEVLNSDDHDFTDAMADWCIEELRYKATLVPEAPACPPPLVVYNGDVVKSDTAVSTELKASLQHAVKVFQDKVPERLKDWHPGSNEKVWDLVHPSLFPLIYGRTRVLTNGETTTLEDCIKRCGQGEIAEVPPEEQTVEARANSGSGYTWQPDYHIQNPFSAKFQWLPCEVDISSQEAKITSYINNLHPAQEKPLYDLVAKLITSSIPLWNLSLAPLADPGFRHGHRIEYGSAEYDPDPENGPETDGPQQEPGEDDDDYWDRRGVWYEETRQVVLPEPSDPFSPLPEPAKFDLKARYAERGLQVIVKLANIELTPEKPEYEGGSWHVEGQMNEHIVATSLYYYSCENVTTSTLSCRQLVSEEETIDIGYQQNYHEWLSEVFGCENEGPTVQEIGGVETREGRLLTFPNILQHRVGPFKLADPTKPGHRKIVALFLVDPNIKVISTAHVPCQQQEWWWNLTRGKENRQIAGLPVELQDHILEEVDFPLSLQEAKALRLELMEERKAFVVDHGKAFEGATFSLCEH
ncbi:hypothetical protein M413DRAFT_447453 [Hebeloma cylindrosporum]|uniref:Uncharacterized protein n=1 Tax=Hebeloma cylindrosporum TaxID=76867 RepID=A0A0C3C4E7_HEBCY|nr:hypothetical protein M413DRAFT_447453 [Hebeloma cylindrosporum h7]